VKATIDGRSLYYEVHGSGDPILFVHGFLLSGELWRPLVPALSKRFRLVIPDLRGHGRSEASARVTMARFADDLAMLLDAIGEDRPVVLVGMSMGGYICFEFHRRQSQRVRAVVLANTRAQGDDPENVDLRREMARRVMREGSRIVAESFATLASMDCPVLIVAGEDDLLTPPGDAIRMQRAAPGSRIEILAGAGHMGPVERPEAFLDALARFLSDLPRQDQG
jgi:3-oxoadipate enol-lactonase